MPFYIDFEVNRLSEGPFYTHAPLSLGQRPMQIPQSPSSSAAPQQFQTSPPAAMGHPPLSPPGQQPPSLGSPPPMATMGSVTAPPMGMSGPPGPGVHQPPLGPQGYPQQPGKN